MNKKFKIIYLRYNHRYMFRHCNVNNVVKENLSTALSIVMLMVKNTKN